MESRHQETRMAINVECECGKSFKVKDELAGKKVKCPACQAVNLVPQGGDDDGDADAPPSRRGEKKKGSKTMLFVGLGAGVVVLGCCCISIGVGSYFLFFSGGPEKQIVGKWTVDMDEYKKSKDYQDKIKDLPEGAQKEAMIKMMTDLMASLTLEIKSDNTMSMTEPMSKTTQTGKWKHVSTKDKIVTIEMTQEGKKTETNKIKVVDSDHIVLIGDSGKPDIAMKRVK
jgi:hypothetical protein